MECTGTLCLCTGEPIGFRPPHPPSIRRDDATARTPPMLHSAALAIGWKSALRGLLAPRDGSRQTNALLDQIPATDGTDGNDDEREPFHLDDTEIALRLVKDRGLTLYTTPPHAHLLFPTLSAR